MTTTAARTTCADVRLRTSWTLVRRLKAGGDERAWQEFYDTYGPLLRSLALKSGLSPEEAQDAVQETVTSVFQGLPRFKADPEAGSFKNWLFRLAQWRIINQFNKRPRHTGFSAGPTPASTDGSTTGTAPIERIADPAPDALERVWDAEWQENVLAVALARLKEVAKARHFQAFYLHVVKGQPPGQVAKALRVSVGQVYLVKCRLLPVFKRIVKGLDAG